MALVTCVFRRGATFYYRTRVPIELRAKLPRRELWRSLRTCEAGEARRRAGLLCSLTQKLWDAVAAAMSPAEAEALVEAWLARSLNEDLRIRDLSRTPIAPLALMERTSPEKADKLVRLIESEELQELASAGAAFGEELRNGEFYTRSPSPYSLARDGFQKPIDQATDRLDIGDESMAEAIVTAVLSEAGVELEADAPAFRSAVQRMMKAQHDLQTAVGRRDAGGWFWRPSSPQPDPAQTLIDSLKPSSPPPPAAPPALIGGSISEELAEPAETLSSVVKAWLADEALAGQSPNRMKEQRHAADRFREWLRDDPPFASVAPRHAGDFQSLLMRMPARGSRLPEYRDLPYLDRPAEAEKRGEKKLLSPATINGNYLDPLRTLFDWGIRSGRITSNPFQRVKAARRGALKRAEKRMDFTMPQLVQLFSQPLFCGAAGSEGKSLYRPGLTLVDDWRFWAPIIALYSGARLNEICGLNLADFGSEEGIAFFHVRADTEGKSVKTEASIRRVPIRSELVSVGLLRHVARLRKRGEQRLFPDLLPGPRGYFSDQPSKFFGRLIERSIEEAPGVVFHSFRHTMISRMRAARVPEDIRKAIVGHEPGDTHGKYGEGDLPALSAALETVTFPSLDLSGLTRE